MDFYRYTNFKYDDFLNDDYFVAHIAEPSPEKTEFWELYTAQHPAQLADLTSARSFILAYRKQDVFVNADRRDLVFEKITQTVGHRQRPVKRILINHTFLRIAAVLALVTSIGIGCWYMNRDLVVTTAFGEIKTVILPDHSTVTLNGNSSVSYARNWNGEKREISIKGEGFFQVKHINKDTSDIKANEKFVVHADDLDIEVLGTSFNVNNRRNETKVGLITGKIKISYADQLEPLIMAPGDYVEHQMKKAVKRVRLSDPGKLTVWTRRQLVFKDATLDEITRRLQDEQGYHIEFDQSISGQTRIEGEINVNTVDELLDILSNTLHVKISREDKNIKITP